MKTPAVQYPEIKNPRYRLLADGILSGKNATQAAIDAGYSERTAASQASQILKLSYISQYIAAHRQVLAEKSQTTQERIVKELTDMAFFNLEDVSRVDADGHPVVDFSNATRAHYAAVTKVKSKSKTLYGPNGKKLGVEKHTELGFADKYRGIELLGRHLGMFKAEEQRVVVDVADRLLNARRRIGEVIEGSVVEDGET